MKKIKKTIIIAEAGVNHNGLIKNIYKLIDIAKKADADYVKFQSFISENLVTMNAIKAKYQIKNNKNLHRSQYKMLKKLELSKNFHKKIIKYCKKKSIQPLFTAFDDESLKFLKILNLKEIKISSSDVNNFPFLKKIAKLNKITFLSTGMSDINDIKKALKVMISNGLSKDKIYLLHCNTDYPTKVEDANLNVIKNFRKKFDLNVGLSDHTLGITAPIIAVALGAVVIEKHFTINKNMNGPDHRSSLEPKELNLMIKEIRNTEKMLGSYEKKITQSERKNLKTVRKSVIAKIDIKKGEKFSLKNLIIKRPGEGLPPIFLDKLIGKKAYKKFKKDDYIKILK